MEKEIIIDKPTIAHIARNVLRAFKNLQKGLTDGTLNAK